MKTITETSIHNTLLNLETLFIGAVLVAAGFAISGFPNVKYIGAASFASNTSQLVQVFIAGLLVVFGLAIAYSQHPLGFATTSVLSEIKPVAIGGILFTIGQFLVGLGNSLEATQPLFAYLIIIAGYTLFVIALVLSGNTGLAVSKLSAPAKAK